MWFGRVALCTDRAAKQVAYSYAGGPARGAVLRAADSKLYATALKELETAAQKDGCDLRKPTGPPPK